MISVSPGKITTLHMPGGHRLDTHVYSGYTIPPNYDLSLQIDNLLKREEAISKMRRPLDEFVIEG
jgi:acetyl-CoA carboxylase biotin carboxylase subunit